MKHTPTQNFLESIEQIREGVMVLENHSLRGIMLVSSLNFSLKSAEEQRAIVSQFQAFLNSLDFSCQIVIQSRKLNLNGYLEKMREIQQTHKSKLLRSQTSNYIEFVESLIEKENILTKKFFLVVPYSQSVGETLKKKQGRMSEENFQRGKSQIWQKMEFVSLGLRRCGLKSIPLTSIELIELLWGLYHPKEAESGYYPEFPPELIV